MHVASDLAVTLACITENADVAVGQGLYSARTRRHPALFMKRPANCKGTGSSPPPVTPSSLYACSQPESASTHRNTTRITRYFRKNSMTDIYQLINNHVSAIDFNPILDTHRANSQYTTAYRYRINMIVPSSPCHIIYSTGIVLSIDGHGQRYAFL